jgi:formylglycine-generating enzyme required for sulfatase activity
MDVIDRYEMIPLPAGNAQVGSTLDEVERCVDAWATRLVSPDYTPEKFRSWILKEFPRCAVAVGAFAASRYPVTNAQYAEFIAATGAREPESMRGREPGRHPVWGVRFGEAEAFCAWLRDRSGAAVRLLTEAEWEYAARGPDGWEYPFGDVFDARLCNTRESGRGASSPVDAHDHAPTALGLRDLAGNVEEWTSSEYLPYPGGDFIRDDLTDALGERYRVLRGGSFFFGGDLARSARRHGPHPGPSFKYTGFRLALSQQA